MRLGGDSEIATQLQLLQSDNWEADLENSLTWIALGIGAAAAALGIAVGRGGQERREAVRGDLIVAALAIAGAVLLFLLTLQKSPPFALGQRLGYGLLIGAAAGVLAGIWTTRLSGNTSWQSGVSLAGLASLALVGVAVVLLIFPDYPQPALAGYLIGCLLTAVLFRLSLPSTGNMEIWALTAVVLAATTLLAVFRFGAAAERFWWRAPMMVLAAAIMGQIAGAAFNRRERGFALPALVSPVVTLALVAVFAWRLFPDWSLFWVALTGVITFALLAWLSASAPYSSRIAAVIVVAVVALGALAFRMMGGFGVGIATLAAWPIILLAIVSAPREEEESEVPHPARVLTYAVFIAIGILIYRLFLESYASEVRGFDLRLQYTFIALALGAVFPFVLMSFYNIQADRGIVLRGVGAGALGFFSAIAPLIVLAIWGFPPALGFLVGTIAAEIFLLFIYAGAVKPREQGYLESALLVLSAQVSMLVFAGIVGPVAQEPRATRVIILAVAALLGLIWAGVSAILSRRPREV
ncbi:MAG: hypothetical protein Q7N50_07625 [Armatimonadota bacterium]|nr:hypothetical protein [Armatimonadota bacterium]